MRENQELQQREMTTWKTSCEKMSASLSRKEMEVQQLHKKLEEVENNVSGGRAGGRTFSYGLRASSLSRNEIRVK